MRFEWDPAKDESNFAKHGIHFEDVLTVFEDPKESHEEESIRIISARAAHPKERARYRAHQHDDG